ncbi:hypothetical protein [Tritonibacter sp. SIMBA_163]|uniref:hypothetical protein n=1 Tax=Tritonibacter sp. SIMBA_163 TaxID=3080868 RepID=UPI003981141A
MTEEELDLIMTFRWPRVVRQVMGLANDDRLMGFVCSIARNGKRRNWHPSKKQEAWMRNILADFDAAHEPEIQLIER